jgi:hypothetical protein
MISRKYISETVDSPTICALEKERNERWKRVAVRYAVATGNVSA